MATASMIRRLGSTCYHVPTTHKVVISIVPSTLAMQLGIVLSLLLPQQQGIVGCHASRGESAFRSMLIDTVSAVLSADEVQQARAPRKEKLCGNSPIARLGSENWWFRKEVDYTIELLQACSFVSKSTIQSAG
eukprot:6092855-Amphidinium_carterae.1